MNKTDEIKKLLAFVLAVFSASALIMLTATAAAVSTLPVFMEITKNNAAIMSASAVCEVRNKGGQEQIFPFPQGAFLPPEFWVEDFEVELIGGHPPLPPEFWIEDFEVELIGGPPPLPPEFWVEDFEVELIGGPPPFPPEFLAPDFWVEPVSAILPC